MENETAYVRASSPQRPREVASHAAQAASRGWRWLTLKTVGGNLRLLLAVVLVPVLVVQVVLYYNRYVERRSETFANNLEVARAVGTTFSAYVADIQRQEGVALQVIEQLPDVTGEQTTALLANQAAQYAAVRDLSVADTIGRIVAASSQQAVGLDISDRSYFREIANGAERSLSDLFVGRASGKPTLAIARRWNAADGSLRGVIFALIEPDNLGEELDVRRAGRGSLAIFDRQGLVVYRYPEVSLNMEQRQPTDSQSLIARALSGQEAMGVYTSSVDGGRRMGSYAPVDSIGWVVGAGILESDVVSPVIQDLTRESLSLLAAALLGLVVASAVARRLTVPLAQLAEHAAAVGSGHYDKRLIGAGPVELRALAEAFNRMSDELRLREQERDGYLHAISHDLRGPLTVVQGQAQLLRHYAAKGQLERHLDSGTDAILTSSQRMRVMIQDLIDSARVQSGQLEVEPQAVAPGEFVAALRQRLANTPGAARVVVSPIPPLPLVALDQDRFERVLLNLVWNALKYSPEDTPVTLAVAQAGPEVVFSVSDRGSGIGADELPHLFERFYRSPNAREHSEGLGLGLYIAKALVEAHDGRIWVDSRTGQGTTFFVALPAVT